VVQSQSHPGNLEKVLNSASKKIVTKRAVQTQQAAKGGAPDSLKGDVRVAIDGTSRRNLKARVYVDDKQGIVAEEGNKPYIIRPRKGKFLKFPGTRGFSGTVVFAREVRHPGTTGTHFLRNALRRTIR